MTDGVYVRTVACIALLGMVLPAWSGELAESYARVLAAEPTIDGARNRVERQRAREDIVGSGLRPQISAQASENQIQERDPFSSQSFQGSRHGVSLSQSLFDLETRARRDREGALTEAAESALILAEHDMALQLTQRFFQVQQARSRLKSLEALVRTLNLRREQARALAEAGQVSRLAIVRLDSRLAERQANLASAEAELQVAEASLLEIDPEFPLRDIIIGLDVSINWPSLRSLDAMIERAMQANPRSRQLQKQLDAEQLALKAIERRRFPVIQFGASFDERDINADNSAATKTETTVYGVSLQWPLYRGGRLTAELDEQGAVLQSVRIEQDQYQRRLRREISEIVSSYQTGQERVAAQVTYLNAQLDAERVLLAAYQQGAVSQSEYLDALDTLASARIARDNAIFLTVISWLRAHVVSGEFGSEHLVWIDALLADITD